MTIGTLSGKILTDLILTGEREFKTLLSPSRIKPVAGFNKLIQQNVDVVMHLVSDRIFMEELKELAEMSNDERRLVGYNDDKLALYKDTNGKLTALDPVCPHAKCVVQWNTAERSCDGPCHGSRFNVEGQILNGPSLKPLERTPLG